MIQHYFISLTCYSSWFHFPNCMAVHCTSFVCVKVMIGKCYPIVVHHWCPIWTQMKLAIKIRKNQWTIIVKSPLLSILPVFMLCMEAVGSFYQYQSLHEDNVGRGSCLVVFCIPAVEGAAAETALVELMSFTIHCSEQLIQLLAVEHIADIGTFCYSSCCSSLSLKAISRMC